MEWTTTMFDIDFIIIDRHVRVASHLMEQEVTGDLAGIVAQHLDGAIGPTQEHDPLRTALADQTQSWLERAGGRDRCLPGTTTPFRTCPRPHHRPRRFRPAFAQGRQGCRSGRLTGHGDRACQRRLGPQSPVFGRSGRSALIPLLQHGKASKGKRSSTGSRRRPPSRA